MGSFQDLLYRYNKTGSIPGAAFGDAFGQMVSGIPSQMPNAMGGVPTHGIAGNVGAKLGETIGGAFKEGKEAAGDLFNRLLNRRMQNLGTGDLMGMGGIG